MTSTRRYLRLALVTLGVLIGGLALSAGPALASAEYVSDEFFPTVSITTASAVALDQSNGDVYLGGGETGDIFKFNVEEEAIEEAHFPVAENPGPIYQMAVDNAADASKGDLYVADFEHETISQYNKEGTLVKKLEHLGESTAVAVDKNGNVYVGIYGNPGKIIKYNDKLESPETVLEGVVNTNALAFDAEGDLYAAQNLAGKGVAEYEPDGATFKLKRELSLGGAYGSLAVTVDQSTGNIFVNNETVIEEFSKAGVAIDTFSTGLSGEHPGSSAISVNEKTKTVYVVNHEGGVLDVFVLAGPPPKNPITMPAEKVEATATTLAGKVKFGKEETKIRYFFDYNTGASCEGGKTTQLAVAKGAEESEVEVKVAVKELLPTQEYSVCLVAKNANGSVVSTKVEHFETMALPAPGMPETGSVEEITPVTATFHGKLKLAKGETTLKYHFDYAVGVSCEGGSETPAAEASGMEENEVAVAVAVTKLTPKTEYAVCLVATNANKTPLSTKGSPVAFKTLALPAPEAPTVLSATAVTSSTATLHGKVKLAADETSLKYHFEYNVGASCEGAGSKTTAEAEALGAENEEVEVSTSATGLPSHQGLAFCLVATNETGSTPSSSGHFTTPKSAAEIQKEKEEKEKAEREAKEKEEKEKAEREAKEKEEKEKAEHEAAAKKKAEEEAAAKKKTEEEAAAKKKAEEEAAAKKKKEEEEKAKAKPTRKQLLEKALKQCKKQPKKSRAKCEATAKKKYGPAKKKKKKK